MHYRKFLILSGTTNSWLILLLGKPESYLKCLPEPISYNVLCSHSSRSFRTSIEILDEHEIDLCARWKRRIKFHFFTCSCPDFSKIIIKDVVYSPMYGFGIFVKNQVALGSWTYIRVLHDLSNCYSTALRNFLLYKYFFSWATLILIYFIFEVIVKETNEMKK